MRGTILVLLSLAAPAADGAGPDEGRDGWPGVLLSADGFELTAPVDGTIRRIETGLGDAVEPGAILLVFDADALRREVDVSHADVAAARSALEQARLRASMAAEFLERRQRQAEVFSREEIREAELQASLAEAAVRSAEADVARHAARLARAKDAVARSRVRAPVAGRVGAILVETGQYVARGVPLVRLVGRDALAVRFAVSPDDAGALAPGDPLVVIAGENRLAGSVRRVAPGVDPPSGTVFVEGAVDAPAATARAPLAGRAVRVFRSSSTGGPNPPR